MPGSVDTGAREPQRAIEDDVVAVRGRLDYPRKFDYIAALEALDRLAALAHRALAAGVGVPPDGSADLVSAPAKERQDAREADDD